MRPASKLEHVRTWFGTKRPPVQIRPPRLRNRWSTRCPVIMSGAPGRDAGIWERPCLILGAGLGATEGSPRGDSRLQRFPAPLAGQALGDGPGEPEDQKG